ncbi:hypothetical protein F3Y22_tig00110599pilonHSYRG00065 [Hibiscus syriacus]|uniref:Uncharacterized protein n=1 Tax=Hibiscus syriacus TaxID=106335 RepID=A0A6A3A213_HIBSY|nr:hypothetical protein F3Y22_tig00110599pilonHSYRG00065 [Hibiscus syriacus]
MAWTAGILSSGAFGWDVAAAEAARAVGSRVEAGAAPRGPRVSNPRVPLWSHVDRWIVPDPTTMSSSHYELSAGDDVPSNDEFKQKVEQVLLIMNFFFLLQMTSSSHYELFLWK